MKKLILAMVLSLGTLITEGQVVFPTITVGTDSATGLMKYRQLIGLEADNSQTIVVTYWEWLQSNGQVINYFKKSYSVQNRPADTRRGIPADTSFTEFYNKVGVPCIMPYINATLATPNPE